MKANRNLIVLSAFLVVGTLLVAFNNCGQGFEATSMSSHTNGPAGSSSGTGSSSGSSSSSSSGSSSSSSSGGSSSSSSSGSSSSSSGAFIPAGSGGTYAPNCLNNSAYDACLFWKNPVAQRQRAYATILHKGTNIDVDQTFGVMLTNRTNPGHLVSASINVHASNGTSPVLVNGQLRARYADDYSKAWVAQLMAYFWLTRQETRMKELAGVFFASNRNIDVNAYAKTDPETGRSDSLVNNASFSFSGNRMLMGYVTEPGSAVEASEMALSAEVYLHEMGHANFHYANNGSIASNSAYAADPYAIYQVIRSNGTSALVSSSQLASGDRIVNKFCNSALGCSRALNEGQADFHAIMIFPERTVSYETWFNNPQGASDQMTQLRYPSATAGLSATDFYNRSAVVYNKGTPSEFPQRGEVHGQGGAYVALMWKIYSNPAMNKSHFAKIFSEHLKMVTVSTRFSEARDALVAVAVAMKSSFGGVDYSSIIRQAFTDLGI